MSIKDELQKLDEDSLRKKIVIPYLKVFFQNVKDRCGPGEKGKDITYLVKEEGWGKDIVGAVIIKNNGDIKMSGRMSTNLRILHSQIMETYTTPIPFPLDPTRMIHIEKITVLTSFDINENAREYIYKNISSQIHTLDFIPGSKFERILQNFIKGKNYEFECNTFKNFCARFSCSSKIEEIRKINIETEARRIDDDAQFEN